jgi:hypothetical protein
MDIKEAIKDFYKLKTTYEKKYEDYVKKIIKNKDLTTREKQQKVARFKHKCVSCNKDGGTLFIVEKNVLKASCNNVNDPCGLNIVIDKGFVYNLEEYINDFSEDVENEKEEIIKMKMNVLFNYKTESEIIDSFEKMKEEFETDYTLMEENLLKLKNIVNNNMELIELKKQNNEITFIIEEIIQTMKEYNKTYNSKIIKNIVETYTERLLPLVKKHMDTKYKVNGVIYNEEDNTYHLVQKKYTYFDLFAVGDPAVVKSFNKGKK